MRIAGGALCHDRAPGPNLISPAAGWDWRADFVDSLVRTARRSICLLLIIVVFRGGFAFCTNQIWTTTTAT
ncbi:hypothetical protein ZEAMMB73_Zm00001d044756 [Zea mays]|uniref:Uncharacterized protein n=1 Tax=Zea mays TaxID=4577 RepID=A0A1D6NR95_MAIZE|nr:hypothetical protein ZEAMMB73_Zm00001d044756 [Zea mays]